jgi:hypothetical protein
MPAGAPKGLQIDGADTTPHSFGRFKAHASRHDLDIVANQFGSLVADESYLI